MLKIEKNIPMPKRKGGGLTEACNTMDVGDSFFIAVNAKPNTHPISAKTGRKFVCAREGDGWRVWRKS